MNRKLMQSLAAWCAGVACVLALGQATAGVNGAIYTTVKDGTTVNGNIYDSKSAVYLNGGPQSHNDPGLVPDGLYYFQVTDPSGSVLLSTDPITCREVTVVGGRITGPTGACQHAAGDFNPSNGQTPVQLCYTGSCTFISDNDAYLDTPNNGGEYKAWLTPVNNYSLDGSSCSSKSNVTFGFCDSDSKTDNFKVKKAGVAYVTVCKFEDVNGDGIQGSLIDEPPIPGWPITATGVDAGNVKNQTVNTQTGVDGCVSFAFTDFDANGLANEQVSLTEGTLGADWAQTMPASGGGYTITLKPGDSPTFWFGNFNQNCVPVEKCSLNGGLTSSKDANAGNKFAWTIEKTVDQSKVNTASDAAFNYTVTLTHDAGTGWKVAGTITLSNNSFSDITANVTDVIDNGGTCDVTNKPVTVGAGEMLTVPYSCTFATNPGSGTNTVQVTDSTDYLGNPVANPPDATHGYDFAGNIIGGTVQVSDPLDANSPRTYSYTDSSPISYTYGYTYKGDPAGTCTKHDNTATFTQGATGSSSQTVTVCVGKDLTASKTAAASYDSSIVKKADQTSPVEVSGQATLSYHVKVTESNWKVGGIITVNNPNDWESVTVNLADALSDAGGSCTIAGGNSQSVAASGTITPAYTCKFGAAPGTTSGTNTATVSWSGAFTPSASTMANAPYAFGSLTVMDTFNNGTPTQLGIIAGNVASTTYTPSYKVTPANGTCINVPNVASIVGGGTSEADVTVCNTNTGALTMGFWKNPNGQAIIAAANQPGLGTWLAKFNPFSDAATSSNLKGYVSTIINAAQCTSSTGTCNAMLRAQMLATALDVYFSDSALGGNKIGAYNGLGANQPRLGLVKIDLTKICPKTDGGFGGTCGENVSSAFGGSVCMAVIDMLVYENNVSNAMGVTWYNQVKATQVLAKDAFDAINNTAAGLCL